VQGKIKSKLVRLPEEQETNYTVIHTYGYKKTRHATGGNGYCRDHSLGLFQRENHFENQHIHIHFQSYLSLPNNTM
jgi:hypothetical protein